MAVAQKKIREVVENVLLTLTYEEARTLRMVTCFISGDPKKSRRKHMDRIGKALHEIGLDFDTGPGCPVGYPHPVRHVYPTEEGRDINFRIEDCAD